MPIIDNILNSDRFKEKSVAAIEKHYVNDPKKNVPNDKNNAVCESVEIDSSLIQFSNPEDYDDDGKHYWRVDFTADAYISGRYSDSENEFEVSQSVKISGTLHFPQMNKNIILADLDKHIEKMPIEVFVYETKELDDRPDPSPEDQEQ